MEMENNNNIFDEYTNDSELMEAFEESLNSDEMITEEDKEKAHEALVYANKIIEKYNELTSKYSETRRLFDGDDDGNYVMQWDNNEYEMNVPIHDALFNLKGVMKLKYLHDVDQFGFRIDDTQIALLIASKQIEPAINYAKDKDEVCYYYDVKDEKIVENMLKEYIDLIYEKRIDNIQINDNSINDENIFKEIRRDLINFCRKLKEKKDYLSFRLLFLPFSDGEGSFNILTKMILWPELPCIISAQDNEKNKNPERKELINDIYDFFYNGFVKNSLDDQSELKKLINSYGPGETFLAISFRREEDKIKDRIEEFLNKERPYIIYDTDRTDFGEDSPFDVWVRNMKFCGGILGKAIEEKYKNLIKFKISFKEVEIFSEDEGQIKEHQLKIDFSTKYNFTEDPKEDIYNFIINELNNNPKLEDMRDSVYVLNYSDPKSPYQFSLVVNEIEYTVINTTEDMLDLYCIYEYR